MKKLSKLVLDVGFEIQSLGGTRTASLVSYNVNTPIGINIPKNITVKGNQYKVTEIAAGAFKNASVSSVTIPDTVVKINSGAFENCKKLNSIVIPKSVVYILGDVFSGANKNLTIYGEAGSEVEKNAKKYNRADNFVANGEAKVKQIEQANTTIAQPEKEKIELKSTTNQSANQTNNTQTTQVSQKSNNSTQPAKVVTDTTIPSVGNYTYSITSGWCKQNTVKFDLKDNSGLSDIKIYLGDSKVYEYSNFGNGTSYKITYVAKKNGTYKIYATDKKGNSGEVGWFYIPNIDDKLPTVQCQISPKDTWSINKKVTITLSDNLGLSSYKIYYKNKIVKQENFSDSRKTHKIEYTAEKNGTYYIIGYDVMGLGGDIGSFTISSIDNVKPIINNYSYSTKSGWCKQNIVKFNISDNLGIKSYKITYNGKIVQSKEYTNSPKSDQISYTAIKNGMYKIYVYDVKGLKSEMGWFRLGNIDNKVPTIYGMVLTPDSKTKSRSKTVTMNLSDVGLGAEKYILTENKDDVKNKNKYLNLTSNIYNSATGQFKKEFTKAGTYYFAVMDKNGNISSTKIIKIKNIDRTVPEIKTVSVLKNEGSFKNKTYYLKNNSKLEIKLKFTENVASIDKSKIKVNQTDASVDAKLSDDKKYCIITVAGTNNTTNINKGTISIQSGFLTDVAGNKSTQNIGVLKKMYNKTESDYIYIVLDNKAPVINAAYDFSNSKIIANITDTSGIAEYQWKIEEAGVIGKVKSGNKATKLEKILTLGKNNGKTVKLWVKDAVGNETTQVITAPVQAKVTYVSRKDNIVTYRIGFNLYTRINGALKNNINSYQKAEDIKDCTIEDLIRDPNDTANKKFLLTVNTHGSEQSAKVHIPKGTLYVYNPNSSEEKEFDIDIDNVKPIVSVSNLPDGKCQSFRLTYYAMDTSGIKKVQLSRGDTVLKSESVKTTGNYTGSINIVKNGRLTLSVWDNQGNRTDSEIAVTCIDKATPIVNKIKYTAPDELGNVVVTIVANEPIGANDWNNTNEKIIKRTYNESDLQGTKVTAENVIIKDRANNQTEVVLEDKIAPRVVGEIQKTVQTNGNTKVVINLSEPIQYTKELQNANWTLSNDKKQLTKEVSTNEEIMVTDLAGNDIEESIKIEVEQAQKFFLNTECVPNDKVTPTTVFTKTISTSKDIKSVDLQNLTGKVDCKISNDKRSFTITYYQSVQTKEQIKVTDIDNEVHKIHINRLVNVVKKGDSNNDGIITQDDYEIMNRNVAGTEKETNQYKVFAMDMNDDGKIDINDLSLLKKLL